MENQSNELIYEADEVAEREETVRNLYRLLSTWGRDVMAMSGGAPQVLASPDVVEF